MNSVKLHNSNTAMNLLKIVWMLSQVSLFNDDLPNSAKNISWCCLKWGSKPQSLI